MSSHLLSLDELRQKEFLRRFHRSKFAENQNLIQRDLVTRSDPLHVVYVMTHVNVCGGSKIIFEHVNRLMKHGIRVTIVAHFEKPTWYPIKAEYIQVPFETELAHGIPSCDVIVATYWDHIQACIDTGIAPVVYFEQGDFHLFDHDSMNPEIRSFVHKQLSLPGFVMTVSKRASEQLRALYNREAAVFPNAVDERIFNPHGASFDLGRPYILMVGSDQLKFKGIDDIRTACRMVREQGYDIGLVWLTPAPPNGQYPDVDHVVINPPQETIGALYRGAVLYVSGSHYESFSLPCLEAMASGCPVVTTRNLGVLEYAEHERNAWLAEIGNPASLAEGMIKILSDSGFRDTLVQNGLRTAEHYRWDRIIPQLAEYYQEISRWEPAPCNSLSDWEIQLRDDQFLSESDRLKFQRYLGTTRASVVRIPVVYPMLEGLDIARWEIAAVRRKPTDGGQEDVYCPVSGQGTIPSDLPYLRAFKLYKRGKYKEAAALFKGHLRQEENELMKVVYMRWAILCLIKIGLIRDAFSILQDLLKIHKINADLYYLYLLSSGSFLSREQRRTIARLIQTLGDAVSYPEFFVRLSSRVDQIV